MPSLRRAFQCILFACLLTIPFASAFAQSTSSDVSGINPMRSIAAQGRVTVPSSATGGFESSKGCFSGMVPAFTFERAGTVLITGGGSFNLAGRVVSPGGDSFSPALVAVPLQQVPEKGGVSNNFFAGTGHVGGLMGAFVPESVVSTPGFQPVDDNISRTGISSSSLFFIGGGRFEFHAPGPGTLFLGINGPGDCGDSGSFSVSLEIPIQAIIFPKPLADSLSAANASAIPIAILGSENFDPRRIDPKSLTLEALSLNVMGTSEKIHCQEKDVNADGFLDLLCEFHSPSLMPVKAGSVLAVVHGVTTDGLGFRAELPLNILPGPPSSNFLTGPGVPQ